MNRKKLVVLTGAGMSAESGIKTFRDDDGLWKNHHFQYLASPEGWKNDRELVTEFYNMRRKQLSEVAPNPGHLALVRLEEKFEVIIITQNVDDLHERAGSKNVLHLHGELKKVRSENNPDLVYELKHWEMKTGDTADDGSPIRPHVVWFGEPVPMFDKAVLMASGADIFLIIGTSLVVYPAASLIHYVSNSAPKYLIDPKAEPGTRIANLEIIRDTAAHGVPVLVDKLLSKC